MLTVHRDTLTQYITFKKGGKGILYCILVRGSLETETPYIDPSVRILTKSPKVGPLLIFSISLLKLKLSQAVQSDP
jgi:hypothetical protein